MGPHLTQCGQGRGGARSSIFGPFLLWPNGWMDQDGTWHGGRPHPSRLCVRRGPSPLPQKGCSPTQLSAEVYYGHTAAWIKMLLGTRVDLGHRDIVFDVDPAILRKRAHPPPRNFWPCPLWKNGWMDEDAAWCGSRPRPRPHFTRRGPSFRERGTAAPSFRPMSIVATVARLSCCWALVYYSPNLELNK